MVKLSDYLNYLYNEVIQARKLADMAAIETAKEYSKNEYLKFFKVPRYTMPSIKLEIPIKVSEIDADVKYNFKMDNNTFVQDVNNKIEALNVSKSLEIKTLTLKDLQTENFSNTIKELEKRDYKYINNKEKDLNRIDLSSKINTLMKKSEFIKTEEKDKNVQMELNKIFRDSLLERYTPVSANLKNIFIDPNTMAATDKDKIMVKMNVEMIDEGIRINSVEDEKGNKIEEIIID